MSRASSCHYFAAPSDAVDAFVRIEACLSLKYVARGLFPTRELQEYAHASDLPNFGYCSAGRRAVESAYLILPVDWSTRVQEVPQRRGGVLYAIDEVLNGPAVILYPGGRYSEDWLVVSEIIGTGDPDSLRAYREIRSRLLKGFVRVHGHYVGPEALKLREQGTRLTYDALSRQPFVL